MSAANNLSRVSSERAPNVRREDEAKRDRESLSGTAESAEQPEETSDGDGDGNDDEPVPAVRANTRASVEAPHSIFSRSDKIFIVVTAALAAFFSPLTANIYYPSINTLADDLHTSVSNINLTITTYLIFQGLAPTFIGALSDDYGRRPAYILCFVIYLCANIGLALQDNYGALMGLRCLQSSGSSGTVALANAVVSDIVTSAQRGSFIAYVTMAALLGPAVGPIIGGALAEFLGWRAIFWFLTIFSGVTLIIILILFPETCRKVVGNGSLPPQKWNNSLLVYLRKRKLRKAGELIESEDVTVRKARFDPLTSVRIIFDKESGTCLLYAGLLFAGFYMVVASLPVLLVQKYNLSTLQVGLCYIPVGVGSLTASLTNGKLTDWNFHRHAKRLGITINKNKQQSLRELPIEAIRLEITVPFIVLAIACCLVYGWVMEKSDSLAGDLVALFFCCCLISAAFNGLSILVVDLNLSTPGSATAAMNLLRCWLGAGGVATVNPLLNSIGIGWTCTLIAGIYLLMSPSIYLLIKHGPKWREDGILKSLAAEEKQKEAKRAQDLESQQVVERDSGHGK